MLVKLLTEHNLEFLSSKGGCTGSFESTLVKMQSNCWKAHAAAHIEFLSLKINYVSANNADQDEMLHYAVFHLGLYCLPK